MKIYHLLFLCYPRHKVLAISCLRFFFFVITDNNCKPIYVCFNQNSVVFLSLAQYLFSIFLLAKMNLISYLLNWIFWGTHSLRFALVSLRLMDDLVHCHFWPLREIPSFHLIYWYWNFIERPSFHILIHNE